MDSSIPASPLVETYDEFDEPADMHHTYCCQLTKEEIEEQSEKATQKALEDLISYLEKNPDAYAEILRKKKVEELENGGIFSYLKLKMMTALQGDQYQASLVTSDETCTQLNELKRGMTRAFQYSQDSKGRRFSSRLAKKRKLAAQTNDENTPPPCNSRDKNDKQCSRHHSTSGADRKSTDKPYLRNRTTSSYKSSSSIPVAKVAPNDSFSTPTHPPASPPSLPPPPPPPSSTLQLQRPPLHRVVTSSPESASDHEFTTPPERIIKNKPSRTNGSTGLRKSSTSLANVQSELLSSNPISRLKSTDITRSPGGTPVRPTNFAPSGPLHKALISVMKNKFRNVRTPSPKSSAGQSQNNSSNFSPSVTLSP